jgi:O-antigen ligase
MLSIADLRRAYDRSRPSGRFRAFHIQRVALAVAPPGLVLAFSLTALLLTASRAGLVATAGIAAVLIATLMLSRASRKSIAAPVGASVLVVVGFVIASLAVSAGAAGGRFSTLGPDSSGRAEIFAAHLAAFKAAPWSGYGLGAFSHINAMVMNSANLPALLYLGATHSVYIQWLEETGVIGAAIMFGLVLIIAFRILAGAVRRARARSWLAAILAVLALFALHGLSDYALQVPSMAIFLSVLLGVGVGLASPRGPRATAPKRAWPGRRKPPGAAGAGSLEQPIHA